VLPSDETASKTQGASGASDSSTSSLQNARKPFLRREARVPTLVWPRELPIEGEPADVVAVVERYGAWLARSQVPKLFINADPGALLTGRLAMSAADGPTSEKSPSRASITSRRIHRRRSVPP
jgi:hypothetical protein